MSKSLKILIFFLSVAGFIGAGGMFYAFQVDSSIESNSLLALCSLFTASTLTWLGIVVKMAHEKRRVITTVKAMLASVYNLENKEQQRIYQLSVWVLGEPIAFDGQRPLPDMSDTGMWPMDKFVDRHARFIEELQDMAAKREEATKQIAAPEIIENETVVKFSNFQKRP